jgi:RNA polymerase sigma-70 factor (ECF subfamily)
MGRSKVEGATRVPGPYPTKASDATVATLRMRDVDTDLVKRAQHGDREAFGLLAADLATRFLSVSRRILRDIDLAEDATQQALVAIWRDLPQLRDPARFDAWSYRLLVRACYAEGRRSRIWSPNLRILPADEPSDSGAFEAIIHRDQLETAIRRLSVDHRTVLVLHHYADLPLERVAQILEIPLGTVHSRLHHAMRAMRAALDADARPAAAEAIR